jgi:outer membrane protein
MMRNFITFIFFLIITQIPAMALSSQEVQDKPVKIGFIDLKRVYEESGSKERYEKLLESLRRDKNLSMNEMKEKLVAMEKMKWELSDEKRKEKEDEINKLKTDLDTFVMDAKTDLNRKMSEYEREFAKELKDVVTKIGEEEGFTYIVSDVILLYSQPKYDLTDKVITQFNEKSSKPAGKTIGKEK